MTVLSLMFWGLVLVTALISLRWGAMVGLIAFVFALLLGAVALSRWAPPASGLNRLVVFDMTVMAMPMVESGPRLSRR